MLFRSQGQINSVWYRFTPTASGMAHFDTCTNVLYDGYMASYTGNAVNNLTNIVFNDDGCGGFATGSIIEFDVTAGTTYSVAVDGWETEVGDFTLTYQIPGGGPPPQMGFRDVRRAWFLSRSRDRRLRCFATDHAQDGAPQPQRNQL